MAQAWRIALGAQVRFDFGMKNASDTYRSTLSAAMICSEAAIMPSWLAI